MTTTELIKLLKQCEFGASGRAREISFEIKNTKRHMFMPDIKIIGSGDGIAGAQLTLELEESNKFEQEYIDKPELSKARNNLTLNLRQLINSDHDDFIICDYLDEIIVNSNISEFDKGWIKHIICDLQESIGGRELIEELIYEISKLND